MTSAEDLIEEMMKPHLHVINALVINVTKRLDSIDSRSLEAVRKVYDMLDKQKEILDRYETLLSVMTLAESQIDYAETVFKKAKETEMFLENHSFSMRTVVGAQDTWRAVVYNIENLASELYRVNKRIVAINKCIHKTEYKLSTQS